ncbi:curlin [Oricola sp.]|uniref:curlin n=1 Tax=Oricola sp. TaxID=1979950 RepID=UPI0025F50E42|nr:curlin [Oricola sp.]MCI5077393.1 curlin [Oricola sp.]
MPRNAIIAGLTAAVIATAGFSAPAHAGGQIAIDIVPGSPEEAEAMRTGLQIYGIINGLQNGANINQLGLGNMAGIGQNGSGNYGVVHQQGNGHSGTLQQNGNNNAYGVFQFGENTNANVTQNGNNGTGATLVFGW